MAGLKGASLVEAIVASILFLIVFMAVMELLPRLAVREDEGVLAAEADYRVRRAFDKYASGAWPDGVYVEAYSWGEVTVRIAGYGAFANLQVVDVSARIDGCRYRPGYRQIIGKEP